MLWVEDWMKCSPRLGFGDSVESDSPTLGGLYRRLGFNPWVRKFPWSRKWQPTPVFWPGKLHGQRSLVGYSPWGHKRVGHDWVRTHTHTHTRGPTHPHLQLMGLHLLFQYLPFLLRQSLLLHPIPLFYPVAELIESSDMLTWDEERPCFNLND